MGAFIEKKNYATQAKFYYSARWQVLWYRPKFKKIFESFIVNGLYRQMPTITICVTKNYSSSLISFFAVAITDDIFYICERLKFSWFKDRRQIQNFMKITQSNCLDVASTVRKNYLENVMHMIFWGFLFTVLFEDFPWRFSSLFRQQIQKKEKKTLKENPLKEQWKGLTSCQKCS